MAESVSAHVTIADYVGEAEGKSIIIGGGIQFIGFSTELHMTAPFSIFVEMQCALPLPDQQVAIELLLVDASGHPVQVPNGTDGSTQALRVAQNVEFTEPFFPGQNAPKGSINARATMTLNFPTGIPLEPRQSYSWRVQADHEVLTTQPFFVSPPTSGPVIG